jgi:hypothetical protein
VVDFPGHHDRDDGFLPFNDEGTYGIDEMRVSSPRHRQTRRADTSVSAHDIDDKRYARGEINEDKDEEAMRHVNQHE